MKNYNSISIYLFFFKQEHLLSSDIIQSAKGEVCVTETCQDGACLNYFYTLVLIYFIGCSSCVCLA